MDNELLHGIEFAVNDDDGSVKIRMPAEMFKQFQEIADKRGMSLVEVLVEALRLESIFADVQTSDDKGLIIRDGKEFREVLTL